MEARVECMSYTRSSAVMPISSIAYFNGRKQRKTDSIIFQKGSTIIA